MNRVIEWFARNGVAANQSKFFGFLPFAPVKGEILEVLFTNNLEQPSTIHWHGIRNINGMDGVPELTQPAIEPGDSFTYRFPVNDSGTFWYHAHFKAWEQVARGLYGALIVTEQEDELNEQDILIIADDWKFTDDYQIDVDSFGNLHDQVYFNISRNP